MILMVSYSEQKALRIIQRRISLTHMQPLILLPQSGIRQEERLR